MSNSARKGRSRRRTARAVRKPAKPDSFGAPDAPVGSMVLESVVRKALKWGEENGMKGRISVEPPKPEGWRIATTIRDSAGHCARLFFTREGRESLWETMAR